jgi:hypothetical protein
MKLIAIIFNILLLFSSCSDNEAINIEGPIAGKWSSIKYETGYSPIENFDIGKIIWEFKKTGTLNVIIDESISSTPVLPTGKYKYFMNENELKITIDNTEYDYEIDNTKLIIHDDPASDGFRIEFIKN